MTPNPKPVRPVSIMRRFLDSESAGGIVLMFAAALALIVANSPFSKAYFDALHFYIGPLSLAHWINDALMAIFFLLVGLEIKREFLDGQLASWPNRMLPGIAAAGGVILPALIFVAFNYGDPEKCTAGPYHLPPTSHLHSAFYRCWVRVCRQASRSFWQRLQSSMIWRLLSSSLFSILPKFPCLILVRHLQRLR